eukprot:UN13322
MVAGTTGESVSLSFDERKRLLEAWVNMTSAYDLNVYAHVGGDSVVASRYLAKHAQSIGAKGVLSMTPNYFTPNTAKDLV